MGDHVIQDVATSVLFGCTLDEALAPHGLDPGQWTRYLDHPDVRRIYLAARRNLMVQYASAAFESRPVDALERRMPDVWGKIDRTEHSGEVGVKLVGGIPETLLKAAAERAKRLRKS